MPAKLDACVADLMAQGKSKDAAYAICTASLKKDGDGMDSIEKRFETCEITKVDDELGIVFGWANVNKQFTPTGEILVEDAHGDSIEDSELGPAVYDFVARSRGMDEMHNWEKSGDLVECMFMDNEKYQAMFPGQPLPIGKRGMWVGFRPHTKDSLAKFKDGTYPAFSIGGKAVREVIEDA